MPKFIKFNVDEMLGMTPIRLVSDQDVWKHLLTPVVRSLLGPVVQIGKPEVFETERGHFPGDDATNLNGHLLYGGQTGFVRYPYISVCHRTSNGALVIKRDGRKIKATAWVGDIAKGKADVIHLIALRDRRFDGTRAGNDSALLSYTYDDPINRPLHPTASAVEVSIYSFFPGSRIADVTGEHEYEKFVQAPYTFLDRPELFLKYFWQAWSAKRHPGQIFAPVPDVSKLVVPGIEHLARKAGYDFLEAAPSHYHVAMWFVSSGYRYTFQKDAQAMAALAAGMKLVRDNGTPLTRSQQSWACVLQSLPAELIPAHLNLGGVKWPQDNIGPENLWINKPLSARAAELVPGPLANKPVPPHSDNAPGGAVLSSWSNDSESSRAPKLP